MKTRIHVSLSVSDITRSTEFYSLLFGATPTKTRDDYTNFRLDEPALHLALVHAPQHAEADAQARHFGVELFDQAELGTWRERLQNNGVMLKIEEQVTCCYAVADKFWAKDPDGNDWEFWVRTTEADKMHESDDAACCTPEQVPASNDASACCTPATANTKDCC